MESLKSDSTATKSENGASISSPASSRGPLGWYLNQMKGSPEEDANEADLVSCLEFNSDGQYLATGDKGGRIVIFKRETGFDESIGRQRADYSFYTTFTSHEPEFDYLKSLEIEEKINKIKWLPYHHRTAHYLLSTNDKTIKLWRINERNKRDPPNLNFAGDLVNASLDEKLAHITSQGYVKLPRAGIFQNGSLASSDETSGAPPVSGVRGGLDLAPQEVTAVAKQVFANAHAYHINAISLNCDQETFLSSDDLRINLWHLNCIEQSFNIVDIKPANMEDLAEVITTAEFHPKHCALFVYSSSKGNIRMCDMRQNALCDSHALSFSEPDDPASRSFFSEIINSISDVRFSPSGDLMLSRDYLTLKVWDARQSRCPVECYSVHEYFRSKLCALYENDCIFDKFECCWSPDERYVMTGSYNNFFRVFDRRDHSDVTLEASRENMRHSDQPLVNRRVLPNAAGPMQPSGRVQRRGEISVECLDYGRKLLHLHWNPVDDVVAMATANNLFILVGKQPQQQTYQHQLLMPQMFPAGQSVATVDPAAFLMSS